MIPLGRFPRRRMLRGILGGAAVTVGLPFLDCFLNENGTALADTSAPLPTRFGTWFWGLGFNPGRWEPKTTGEIDALGPELAALEPWKAKINVYSGMKVLLDGRVNTVHFTGPVALITGTVPAGQTVEAPSMDVLVSDVIGTNSRFRSLEVSCTGDPLHSQSRRSASAINPGEVSPLALYTRVFGPGFADPNAATFTPDPHVMVKRSALTAVADDRKAFVADLGAADRVRVDEYFTALRELEKQLDISLQKPAPLAACSVPAKVDQTPTGTEIETVKTNHRLFAQILAHALACGQTRVINIAYANANSSLRRAGAYQTHHEYSHEEPVDSKLGYQPEMTSFYADITASFAELLTALDSIREGDATLLDRTLVVASTDTGYAKLHSLDNIPLLTAGGAGGRMKTGLHVAAVGDPGTRVGLTALQAIGIPVSSWGTRSMEAKKAFSEVLA
jgi:hypothetical protein